MGRPRTPMWKAGVIPHTKRYAKGGELKANAPKRKQSKKKSS